MTQPPGIILVQQTTYYSIEALLAKNPNLLDHEEDSDIDVDGKTSGKKEKKKKKWNLRRSKSKDIKSN